MPRPTPLIKLSDQRLGRIAEIFVLLEEPGSVTISDLIALSVDREGKRNHYSDWYRCIPEARTGRTNELKMIQLEDVPTDEMKARYEAHLRRARRELSGYRLPRLPMTDFSVPNADSLREVDVDSTTMRLLENSDPNGTHVFYGIGLEPGSLLKIGVDARWPSEFRRWVPRHGWAVRTESTGKNLWSYRVASKRAAHDNEAVFRSAFSELAYEMKPGVAYGIDYFYLVGPDMEEIISRLASRGGLI